MLNLSEIIIHKIYELHSNGFSNRKIAKQLNINHKTVSSYLNKKNLVSNISPRQKSKYINNNLIECSKCKIVTFEHNFLICRRGKINQYRLSYCNQCRNKQLLKNINSNKFKILSRMDCVFIPIYLWI
jgi:predicted transcriptional regulator